MPSSSLPNRWSTKKLTSVACGGGGGADAPPPYGPAERKVSLPRESKVRVDNCSTGFDLFLCMELGKNSYLKIQF